jgi:hypothetical protein
MMQLKIINGDELRKTVSKCPNFLSNGPLQRVREEDGLV